MLKRVLITGGAGFLGVHLARHLLKKSYKVTLLDVAPLTAKDLAKKVEYVKADIRQRSEKLESAIQKADYIVHAAASLPIIHKKSIIYDTNIKGTENVLKYALFHHIKRLVFISSTAVYGVPKKVPELETDHLSPIGHYGVSKVAGEKLCMKYYKAGLSINILRPKTFLGPERLGVFSLWFEAIYNNTPVFILGSGHNLYQLLDVKDLCEYIERALISKKDGEVFNIGAKDFGTWKQDLRAVIAFAKSRSKIIGFPVKPSQIILSILERLNLSPIVAWHYLTIPINSYVSTKKAEKILKYTPQISNQKLLIESYKWYKNNRSKIINNKGLTHRTIWNFKALSLINYLFSK